MKSKFIRTSFCSIIHQSINKIFSTPNQVIIYIRNPLFKQKLYSSIYSLLIDKSRVNLTTKDSIMNDLFSSISYGIINLIIEIIKLISLFHSNAHWRWINFINLIFIYCLCSKWNLLHLNNRTENAIRYEWFQGEFRSNIFSFYSTKHVRIFRPIKSNQTWTSRTKTSFKYSFIIRLNLRWLFTEEIFDCKWIFSSSFSSLSCLSFKYSRTMIETTTNDITSEKFRGRYETFSSLFSQLNLLNFFDNERWWKNEITLSKILFNCAWLVFY